MEFVQSLECLSALYRYFQFCDYRRGSVGVAEWCRQYSMRHFKKLHAEMRPTDTGALDRGSSIDILMCE